MTSDVRAFWWPAIRLWVDGSRSSGTHRVSDYGLVIGDFSSDVRPTRHRPVQGYAGRPGPVPPEERGRPDAGAGEPDVPAGRADPPDRAGRLGPAAARRPQGPRAADR